MKGFIIQVNDDYVNWQNLIVSGKENALMLGSEQAAEAVAKLHRKEGVSVWVLPHENTDTVAGVVSSGSYFEYHKEF
jgi:hypothetical protein